MDGRLRIMDIAGIMGGDTKLSTATEHDNISQRYQLEDSFIQGHGSHPLSGPCSTEDMAPNRSEVLSPAEGVTHTP